MKDQALLLGEMIALAAMGHKDQLDRGGAAYFLHPLRILFRLRTRDNELMQMAAGHDLVEDSNITLDHLRALGFSERVIAGLDCLTHREGESYDAYIDRIATNPDAVRIKLEDLRDNSDITRMKGVRDKDVERLKKYFLAFQKLSALVV
jgi:(p)ppGpp synthase/HD superfamily hydrolase